MSDVILLIFTGLSVGAVYFLLGSGLALIFGLMRVLTFAHGAYLTACAYAGWLVLRRSSLASPPSVASLLLALLVGIAVGGTLAFLTERILLRALYKRDHLDQLLITAGLGFSLVALLNGVWGPDNRAVPTPAWFTRTTTDILGAHIARGDFVLVGAAILLLVALEVFLKYTRHGLVVRAGVENREMVRALGIDVRRSFTLVFTIGGAVAGLGGVLAALYANAVNTSIGDSYLLYAFIVLVVGGLGSLRGAAIAAVAVGLLQQFANFYVNPGLGEILSFVLMGGMLLLRPEGVGGKKGRLI
ncbi:branched-chain amino acid ABC transporter permease [Actinoallomurus bryophytorum]|uniref:Branched-chain amino acid transport system permease protein n=1 Tax=Actinoallomurus bryophytorum TaxID=1490222 RepID=A0A543BZ87_9ACTN|nr:branched-chain amino acid ABC transporter permease [Actinoallomurus bryophytorum]TQL90135.1 branched-chain amino acid transport system permease protein [Actinoallomurus bryophytorum]